MQKNKLHYYFFLIFLTFSIDGKTKNYDLKSYTCADEVGPRLEFSIPNLQNLEEANFTFKVFKVNERNSYSIKNGVIKKESSPIDHSYFFYRANSLIKKEKKFEITFEFYPPSHLLIQNENSQFTDLVCWNQSSE